MPTPSTATSASPVRMRVLTWLCILMLAASGCAGVSRRQRITRAVVAVGGLVTAAGGAMTAGCISDNAPGVCSATPKDGTVSIGLPVVAVGLAIMVGAMLTRPKSQRPTGPPITRHAVGSGNQFSPGDPFGPAPNQGY